MNETQQTELYNHCFRMAGVFDIDLETEDISDTEVCILQSLMRPPANTSNTQA